MPPEPRIVYEDKAIIVIDKPAGMPSTSLDEGEGNTVSAWLADKFPEQAGIGQGAREAGLANRLDNDTSGLIVAARTNEAHAELRRQFSEGRVRKRYIALVLGDPPERGTADASIAHHPRKAARMVACESAARAGELKARPAHTAFYVLSRLELNGSRYALLEVTIKTGVRHQVRVHLAHLGFPISGDRLYRNPKKRAADPLKPTRHVLHSSKLTLTHPETGRAMTFASPLPSDLKGELARLRQR